ncbi:putative alcohol O-acetyltransferase [Helianthus debilis subsp. tardiflorus]
MTSIEIISKEHIKPSSPTPQHLKSYNLSILDQLIPAPYAPIILYYPNQDQASEFDIQQRLNSLKDSLSETLTRFYPLAGTIKSDLLIDCNDVGAYFAVTRVNTRLNKFLNHVDLDLINRFLPCEPTFNGCSEGSCVSNVQVTIFECCGIAISLCISHKILDGGALSTFVKSWAGSSNGLKEVVYPNMSAPSLFPAKDLWLKDSSMVMWGSLFKMGKCRTTRFVFDSTKLAILKAKASKNGLKDPTRVEVVSGLLWKCVMAAFEENTGSWKPSLLSHVVNLRKRLVSTLSENSIGNLIFIASAKCDSDSRTPLHKLVEKVRGGVSKINGEFVKKLQGDKGREVMEESLKAIKDCANYIGFTSWCKMGFYEADFGWGKPVWVCGSVLVGHPVFMNFVVLNDTQNGDGIEAWVSMDEAVINVLKHDPELLEFASVDPSPLQMV